MSTKGKITYGTVEVDDEDLEPSKVRRRISIMIPEDVISKLTAMGQRESVGYQTVINRLLREAVDKAEPERSTASYPSIAATLKRIEKLIIGRALKPPTSAKRAATRPSSASHAAKKASQSRRAKG
jgi:hypothetical protein